MTTRVEEGTSTPPPEMTTRGWSIERYEATLRRYFALRVRRARIAGKASDPKARRRTKQVMLEAMIRFDELMECHELRARRARAARGGGSRRSRRSRSPRRCADR